MQIFYNIINSLSSPYFKISLGIFIFIVIVCFFLISLTGKEKTNRNLNRLEKLREYDSEEENEIPMYEENNIQKKYNQYIKPYINKNKSLYDKLLNTFGINVYDLQKQLTKANINKYNGEQLATLKIGGLLIGSFLGITLFLFSGTLGLLLGFGIGVGTMILPNMLINQKYEERKKEILNVLPTTLRMLADATSTGHTIEDAIMRVRKKYKNTLSTEFEKVEQEAKYTNDWLLALEHMDERCDIMEVTNLISEIKITKQKGTSITDVLTNFAKKMDKESMIRITEEARKKQTTLLMPILLFLFGPLLGLILLPALNLVINAL